MIRFEMLNGRGGGSGVWLPIASRELSLLYILGAAGRPMHSGELEAAVWPQGFGRRGALHQTLHRARLTLGSRDAIRRMPTGYVLGPMLCVDVDDPASLERELTHGTAPPSAALLERARSLLQGVRAAHRRVRVSSR